MSRLAITRRKFITTSCSAAGIGVLACHCFPAPSFAEDSKTLEKLNIAHVGIARQGAFSLNGCASENQIALCDSNSDYLEAVKKNLPHAELFTDFRDMLDRMGDKLDAIVVATPDHTHAPIAVAGMKLGLN